MARLDRLLLAQHRRLSRSRLSKIVHLQYFRTNHKSEIPSCHQFQVFTNKSKFLNSSFIFENKSSEWQNVWKFWKNCLLYICYCLMTSLLLIWNATHLFSQNIIQKWPKSSGEVGTKILFSVLHRAHALDNECA